MGQTTRRRPTSQRPIGPSLALAALLVAPLACGDPEDASLCTAFVEYIDVRSELYSLDPATATAAELIDVGEDYLAAVHRLEQASDTRYTQQLDALDTAGRAILLTLASLRDDADRATWNPLIADDLETGQVAAQQVIDAIAPSCLSVVSVEPVSSQAPESSDT